MKICVFSDIHGNGFSFRPAFQEILNSRANLNVFLGDLCGYYYDQMEIFEMLMNIPNLIAIRGNHDQMFLDIMRGDQKLRRNYIQKFGLSMENLLSQRHKPLSDWLESLPLSFEDEEKKYACFHGSPKNPLEGYVYPDSPVDCFDNLPASYCFLGHTHHKMNIDIGKKIINPGSLGQPRDYGWPTFALVSVSSGEVKYEEVVFDINGLSMQIKKNGDSRSYFEKISKRWTQ
ncbi:metallophosphoesterase [Candidatus Parcubacteria bacterium]|nr:MAG: metallophosphoesterase [Candidatus Parcubacteria bacterium]